MGRAFRILVMLALCCGLAREAGAQFAAPPAKDAKPAKDAAAKPSDAGKKPAKTPSKKPPESAAPEVPKPEVPKPDTIPRRIPPVPMEVFAAEPEEAGGEIAASVKTSKPEEPSACRTRVADKIAVIEPLPALGGPGDCGATDVVRFESVILPDNSRVAITPPATMRCTMAEALAIWVREDLTATLSKFGAPPKSLDNYASYDCRGRNRIAGARISEHGLANAIDIRGVHMANGKFAEFTDRKLDREFREAVRQSVCARFTTVLGPGSDGHHETHIHMDLAERRGGYRLCQWNVLDPAEAVPLPRPRPREAP